MSHVDKKSGFTLIELMLAMGFVSVLLIAIAMTVIQIGNIYNRGLTLKEVNQAGRSLSSELQRSISESAPFNISPGEGNRYIKQTWGGRLCLGNYSYIWNYGKDIKSGNSNLNVYSNPNSPIRFVKVTDPNTSYCKDPTSKINSSDAVELINVDQHDLVVHSFNIGGDASADNTRIGQRLYYIDFVIGTNDGNALMVESGVSCKPPSYIGSDLAYCSVNQFNIVARAGNVAE